MQEEEKKTPEVNPNESGEQGTNAAYLDAIKDLKSNSVPRSEYEALKADNKRLLDAYVNGQRVETPEKEEKADIGQLRSNLFKEDVNNLEYWTNALKLREALIAKGEPDPFLPIGKKITPTNEDIEAADRVASVVKECIDYAEGDSAVFTNELQRRTIDTAPQKKRR